MPAETSFILNGEAVVSKGDPRTRLLDVLREEFLLTGTKCGCGEGECGACSVLMDGALVVSCLMPLGNVEGKTIVTIEGFRQTTQYAALERAFGKCGAVQCGFCTPGMILASEALLSRVPHPTEAQIREGLSGNLCRCTGYGMIIEAVHCASEEGKGLW